eukprot:s2036_g13.t1
MADEDFKSPWMAVEDAVDQCVEVFGLDACSRLLDGSSRLCGLPAKDQSTLKPSRVKFDLQIELLYGSEEGAFSSEFFKHDFLHEWTDKPWSLQPASQMSIVEPLLSSAMLSPTDRTGVAQTNVTFSSANPSQSSPFDVPDASEGSVLMRVPPPTDNAIYDMDRSWLMQLQCDWREHAVAEHQGEGRILNIRTWYLHHQEVPRCAHSRLLKLDYMDHLWLSDIRELWADMIRAGEVLHLTYVAPQPPRADHQPVAPHTILSQGLHPERIGVVLTARFLEDHRTHLLQEAVTTPPQMCGTRAVDLLRIPHLAQHRRWIARAGVMMFSTDELEDISDGLSINIDIRVPPPEHDETSLAAWNSGPAVSPTPVMHVPDAVQQDAPFDPGEAVLSDSDSAHSPSGSDSEMDEFQIDWRFTHLYRTKRRVFHGHLPWNDAADFHHRVARMAGIEEDDIVRCHHVAEPPADLKAASTEALLLQSVADLPIGSVRRLVLTDVEFHEHVPATDHSTSRRCLSLPHQVHRRVLLRLLGLHPYCERVQHRGLVWINNHLIPWQRSGLLHLHHGDYLRVAVPPIPHVNPDISTRICVSRARTGSTLLPSAPVQHDVDHEDGMTDIDDMVRQMYSHERRDHSSTDDTVLMQLQMFKDALDHRLEPSKLLASETAAMYSLCINGEPMEKLENDTPQRVQAEQAASLAMNPVARQLLDHPPS